MIVLQGHFIKLNATKLKEFVGYMLLSKLEYIVFLRIVKRATNPKKCHGVQNVGQRAGPLLPTFTAHDAASAHVPPPGHAPRVATGSA